MTPTERRAAVSLAAIFTTRMLGLFMILPVFALYAEHLDGVTPALVGLAIGIYGLSQAVLQIPFGLMSDRLGRKPVIAFGLVVFALGSVVAAVADSITGVIIGRALQGSGAIAAAVMALAADLTREEHRLKAMATIGASIGLAFTVSLILGPVLNHWIGVPGIFWLTALLALVGIAILYLWVPTPGHSQVHRDAEPVLSSFGAVLRDGELLRLDFGIFTLHMLLTASFVVVPLALRDHAGLATAFHWVVYLGVMVVALAAMVPLVIIGEKRRKLKQIFVTAVAMLGVGELLLLLGWESLPGIVLALLVFFTAFNVLEATLPSLVAKVAPADKKGTAMGVYSSSQFLGAFAGGALGGGLHGALGLSGVFGFCTVAAAVWVAVAATMAPPRYLSSRLLHVGPLGEAEAMALAERLRAVPGVEEAVVAGEEGVAYLKVDHQRLAEDALREFSTGQS
ncbi:MAG TPA: MFS transporter [Gammaproteobacteria bacterium]|nr:MFS transporter [Gammaproteobacteria bacterium]